MTVRSYGRARILAMCSLWPLRFDLCPFGHRKQLCKILSISNLAVRSNPLGHGQQLCKILSISNLAVRSYSLDMDFDCVFTVTLILEIWPSFQVLTHMLGSWTTILWNIIQIQNDSKELWTRHRFWLCSLWPWTWRCELDPRSWHILGSWSYLQGQGNSEHLGHGQQLCKILSRSNMAVKTSGLDTDFDCSLRPWPWRYDLGSRSWHTLGS